MALVFQIIKGPGEGSRFNIEKGATIGRKNTSIVLQDSNVSSQHARVDERGGELYLVDVGSANGLKVQGKKLLELKLKPGAVVKLGRTTLRVDEGEPDLVSEAVSGPVEWSEALVDVVERLKGALEDRAEDFVQTMRPFSPPLEFKFENGPQTGESWVIGFGPRSVGARVVDLKIREPESPDVCFSIRPSEAGPLFRTDHPEVVKVNGESRDIETLKNGDTIEILGTRIAVLIEAE